MTEDPKPTVKVGVGYWRTRSGLKAHVAMEWADGQHVAHSKFIGWVIHENGWAEATSWSERGSSVTDDDCIVGPWREPVSGTAFAVLHYDKPQGIYLSRDDIPIEEAHMGVVKVRYEEIPE